MSRKSKKNQIVPKYSKELEDLQKQKDELTVRYRDDFRQAVGEEAFSNFSAFLLRDFMSGSTQIQSNPLLPEQLSPQVNEFYNILLYDDNVPTVSGWAALYFDFQTGSYYHPKVYSLLRNATTGQNLSLRSHTGFRSITPARIDHPTFFATRGQTYCQYSEYYGVTLIPFSERDKDEKLSAAPDAEIFITSLEICRTYPFPPTPTPTPPTPTPTPPTPTPTPTPTPNVTSVTFEQVTPSTLPIDANPAVSPHNPGIGRRIFPDDDTPQDGVDRRRVRVTATLSQPIPNVNVYFRSFDLDDPATDPIIDTNGNAGDDNNGMPRNGQLQLANGCGVNQGVTFCPSDSSGRATIEFTITRQPGDNFAIAASVILAEAGAVNINGTELTNGSGQNIPTNCPTQLVCRSEMLTVWRRLHIEVDSMGASTQNFVLGTTTQIVRIRAGQQGTIPVASSQPLEINRFENGRIEINFRSYVVVSNTTDSVTI